MKQIKVKSISLSNFRGQTREVTFKDGRTDIVGSNGVGKSTIFEAFLWCIRGVDSLNRTNYELYDNRLSFAPENAIPAIVEVVLSVDDKQRILRRQAKQKWYRPRGESEYKKDKSDEYKFFVDELEVTASMYKEAISSIFGIDLDKLGLALNIRSYQMMDWKELRKVFSDIVGDVLEEDYVGDYSAIAEYVSKYPGDRVKEYFKQQISPLKKKIDELDSDIRAIHRQMPNIEDVDKAEKEIIDIQEQIRIVNQDILSLKNEQQPMIDQIDGVMMELREAELRYNDKEQEYYRKNKKILFDIENELLQAETKKKDIQSKIKINDDLIAKHKSEIEYCKEQLGVLQSEENRLRQLNKELKSRQFNVAVCPTCGQELPADMMNELRVKFYSDIEEQRKPIVENGLKTKAARILMEGRLKVLEAQEPELLEIEDFVDVEKLKEKRIKFKESIISFEQTEEGKELKSAIDSLKKRIVEVKPNPQAQELQDKSARLVARLTELSKKASLREQYDKSQSLISEYESQKQSTGVELAMWEGYLDLFIRREREWAEIVSRKANQYLDYAHVEMTEISKAGDLVDTCTLSIEKVDRGVTNRASQTIIGIDVSNAICKRYNVSVPLFIDDFEHFTHENTYSGDRQVITLSASKNYNELTII